MRKPFSRCNSPVLGGLIMSIPPTIRAGSSRGRAYPTHANPWNRQAAKLSSSFRNGPEKVRSSTRSVQGAVPALNLRSSVDPGPCDSAELTGSRAGDRQNHLLVLRGFWSRPIERNVLAGLAIGLPPQPQSVHPMRCSLAPGSHLSRADLRARRV